MVTGNSKQEHAYYLHAVIIHQGFAESGHYYCYVYDRRTTSWWRFNDHTVSQECEQVVMEEAYGGNDKQGKTAYSLIYINEQIANMLEKVSIVDMYKGTEKTLDPQLKKYIQDINHKFDQEITQAKVERIVKTIVE